MLLFSEQFSISHAIPALRFPMVFIERLLFFRICRQALQVQLSPEHYRCYGLTKMDCLVTHARFFSCASSRIVSRILVYSLGQVSERADIQLTLHNASCWIGTSSTADACWPEI